MDNRTIDITSEKSKALELALRIIWDNCPGGKASHYKIMKLNPKTTYITARATVTPDATFAGETTHHYTELKEDRNGTPTLILLWGVEQDAQPLPFKLDLDGAINFVNGWLNDVEYGEEPDHDGSNYKGWRVFTEDWGHVAGYHYAIVGIQPIWAMYGK